MYIRPSKQSTFLLFHFLYNFVIVGKLDPSLRMDVTTLHVSAYEPVTFVFVCVYSRHKMTCLSLTTQGCHKVE